MPTDTFANLPAEKRDRILAAAIVEFASHSYADANLDRIAAVSQVSKGSLFQYFEGKGDFYVYAVETALDRGWSFYQDIIARAAPADCFELLTETLLSMVAFKKRRPHLAALYLRVVYAKDSYARDRLFEAFVRRNKQFLDELITSGIQSGHIDASLPLPVVRFHIHAIGSQFTYLTLSGDDPRWLPRSAKDVRELVAQTVAGLSRAIGPASSKRPKREHSK